MVKRHESGRAPNPALQADTGRGLQPCSHEGGGLCTYPPKPGRILAITNTICKLTINDLLAEVEQAVYSSGKLHVFLGCQLRQRSLRLLMLGRSALTVQRGSCGVLVKPGTRSGIREPSQTSELYLARDVAGLLFKATGNKD
jgi:hypothetical protein